MHSKLLEWLGVSASLITHTSEGFSNLKFVRSTSRNVVHIVSVFIPFSFHLPSSFTHSFFLLSCFGQFCISVSHSLMLFFCPKFFFRTCMCVMFLCYRLQRCNQMVNLCKALKGNNEIVMGCRQRGALYCHNTHPEGYSKKPPHTNMT